jgi:diguanylate cyclase (GGDEF)-like protein
MSDYVQLFTGICALSLLFATASMILVASNRTVDHNARAVFLFCIATVAVITVFDWFDYVVCPTIPQLRGFHVGTMAFTFALAPVLPVAIAHTIFPERYVKWVVVILVLQALLEVATVFGGFVFWVDESNVYHRGPLYAAYMAVYSISALYLSYESIKAGRTYQSVNNLSIACILLFLALGVGVQVINPTIRTTWPTVVLVITLYFVFYAEMVLRTDALTRLLNRRSYEDFLDRTRTPCAVVLIDVDNFKHVNDTYGHRYGDICLQTIAKLIRRAFGGAALCFRTGGDEFTVMVTKHRDQTEEYVERLHELVDKACSADPRLPTVSAGIARSGADGVDLRAALLQADANMYETKRARKARANTA